MPSPCFLLLCIFLFLTSKANATTRWMVPNKQHWPLCDTRRDFAAPSSFPGDCLILSIILREPQIPNHQRELQTLLASKTQPKLQIPWVKDMPDRVLDSESYLDQRLCRFSATQWQRGSDENGKDLIEPVGDSSSMHDYWFNLWPSLSPYLNIIFNTCVNKEHIGGSYTIQDVSSTTFILLAITNLGLEDLVDIGTSSTSSNQSFFPPLPQNMNNDLALEIEDDAARPSDAAIQGSLCRWCPSCWTAPKFQNLRQNVCHWCSSCWSTDQNGWTRRIAILAALGTWGGPIVSDRVNALWSHPTTDPNAAAQLAASQLGLVAAQTDLGRCTEQLADLVARLAAWKEMHPTCPGPSR